MPFAENLTKEIFVLDQNWIELLLRVLDKNIDAINILLKKHLFWIKIESIWWEKMSKFVASSFRQKHRRIRRRPNKYLRQSIPDREFRRRKKILIRPNSIPRCEQNPSSSRRAWRSARPSKFGLCGGLEFAAWTKKRSSEFAVSRFTGSIKFENFCQFRQKTRSSLVQLNFKN